MILSTISVYQTRLKQAKKEASKNNLNKNKNEENKKIKK